MESSCFEAANLDKDNLWQEHEEKKVDEDAATLQVGSCNVWKTPILKKQSKTLQPMCYVVIIAQWLHIRS